MLQPCPERVHNTDLHNYFFPVSIQSSLSLTWLPELAFRHPMTYHSNPFSHRKWSLRRKQCAVQNTQYQENSLRNGPMSKSRGGDQALGSTYKQQFLTDVSRLDKPFARWDEDQAKNVARRLACEYDMYGSEAVFVRVNGRNTT